MEKTSHLSRIPVSCLAKYLDIDDGRSASPFLLLLAVEEDLTFSQALKP